MESIQTYLLLLLGFLIALPFSGVPISILAYLVSLQLDFNTGSLLSATTIGYENAIIGIAFPSILLLKTRLKGLRLLLRMPLFRIWLFFIVYTMMACIWSPYKVAAIKQIGYFYGYTISFSVIFGEFLYDREELLKMIRWSIIISLILAFLNYFIFDIIRLDTFGFRRFSTFNSAQTFGLYLSLMLGPTLLSVGVSRVANLEKFLVATIIFIALFLTGSRIGIICAVTILSVYMGTKFFSRRTFSLWIGSILLASASFLLFVLIILNIQPNELIKKIGASRTASGIEQLLNPKTSLYEIGTLRFRLNTYKEIVWATFNKHNILFGSGTSSSGDLVANRFISYRNYNMFSMDANRIVHNEYLRSFYEWGIIGTILLIFFVVGITIIIIKTIVVNMSVESNVIGYCSITILYIYMTSGNVFSQSASSLGGAIIITLSYLIKLFYSAQFSIHLQKPKMYGNSEVFQRHNETKQFPL